jgi:hypothetical protein
MSTALLSSFMNKKVVGFLALLILLSMDWSTPVLAGKENARFHLGKKFIINNLSH